MVYKTLLNLHNLSKTAVPQSLNIFFKRLSLLPPSLLGQILVLIYMGLLLQSKFVCRDDRAKAGELL